MKYLQMFTNYLKASIEELKKVAWPTRAETTRYSVLVIAISLAIAISIGVLDFIFTAGLEAVVEVSSPTPVQVEPAVGGNSQRIPITPEDIQAGGVIDAGNIQIETKPIEE